VNGVQVADKFDPTTWRKSRALTLAILCVLHKNKQKNSENKEKH